jgi:cytoskeletal protein CcmA (bactofilin family)
MKVFKDKKGMSLPTMLAIVFLVISTVFGLITVAKVQANLVQQSIEFSEEYVNATRDIEAINFLITRDQITDEVEIAALALYLDLEVEVVSGNIYRFSRNLNSVTKDAVGYLAPKTSAVSTYDEIFIYTGTEETFELSPLINATTMLAEYSKGYLETSFPDLVVDGDFSSFDSIVQYYKSLTNEYYLLRSPSQLTNQTNPYVNNYWFIDGNVVLSDQDLTIDSDYTLVINGNLITNGDCNLSGNIIVNGNVEINGSRTDNKNIVATLYVAGDVYISRNSDVGTLSRPAFIIAGGDINLDNQITIYGYFLASNFYGQQGNNFITGGVYTTDDLKVNDKNLEPGTSLDSDDLYSYAIATSIIVQSESGETSFTYTSPKLE